MYLCIPKYYYRTSDLVWFFLQSNFGLYFINYFKETSAEVAEHSLKTDQATVENDNLSSTNSFVKQLETSTGKYK